MKFILKKILVMAAIILMLSGNVSFPHGVSSTVKVISSHVEKSIVYILPYEKCSDYWTKTYGDRIYYYVYGNLTQDRKAIEEDFRIISTIYSRVIIVIPAEDTPQYLRNLKIVDGVAGGYGLQVVYAIFPNEKYGKEDTYLDKGSKMHNLVLYDMNYLTNLNATYKVAIWYGWTYRCNSSDIVNFYKSLSENLQGKYAVWLDEEYVERVKDVYDYGLPRNVLFITEAYDKEEVASYSILYSNQMLVTGYEGAKSLEEWKINIENLLSVCRTNDVGIWIFYDIGDGAGEEYAAFINGSLTDFNFGFNMSLQKGFSYAAWWNDTFLSEKSDVSLENLKDTGTEWVSLVTTWYQNDEHSVDIEPDKDATPSDKSIIHAINTIHSLGMKVMLKPHVDLYNGEWRGEIQFDDEQHWQEWFKSYKNFICHYARLAEQQGVEQFCIGCELVKTTAREEWFDVIEDVRKNFSGIITYAADWSNYYNVTFWNYLDFVGIDAYFELTDKNNPTLEELMKAWKKWKPGIEEMHNLTGKPIIFTEIGYRSIDGCNRDPWNWQRHGKIDLNEQRDCYEAAFKMFYNEPWFYGFYWWMWWPDPSIGGANDDSYTPYKKPAEGIIKFYYKNISIYARIEKPKEGYIYFFDREIMTIGDNRTIIIGAITVEAETNGNKVEFYIDDELKCVDSEAPFSWQWNEFAVGSHEIMVKAYDNGLIADDRINTIVFMVYT